MAPNNTTSAPRAPTNIASANARRKAQTQGKANAMQAKAKAAQKQAPPSPKGQANPSQPGTPAAVEWDATKDYTDASTYITDFYYIDAEIAEDLWDAASDAVDSFFITTTMPDNRLGGNLAYQLIRIALGILPSSSAVVSLWQRLGNLTAEAAKTAVARVGVVAQRTAAGTYNELIKQATDGHMAARTAKDLVSAAGPLAKKKVLEARDKERKDFDVFVKTHPELRSNFLIYLKTKMGPKPNYDPDHIVKFGRKYEADLYKTMYKGKAHLYIREPLRKSDVRIIKVWGIPLTVLERLVELTGAASVVAAVHDWNLPRKQDYHSLNESFCGDHSTAVCETNDGKRYVDSWPYLNHPGGPRFDPLR